MIWFIELLDQLEPRYLVLSTKYFNETTLPQAYNSLKMKISNELSEGSFLSFTSVCFSCNTNIVVKAEKIIRF